MGVLPAMKQIGSGGRLTRGLASLLSRTAPGQGAAAAPARHQFVEIPVARISANAYQPRRRFDPGKLSELASSIRESGLLQPVIVRRSSDGFELVAGERRLRAAKEAGLGSVPAIVRNVSEDEMLELALVENVQREGLNPIELARAYALLAKKFGLTQDRIASRLSLSRPAVANTLRLLELPEAVREMVSAGRLSAGHARAVLSVADESARVALAREIMERGLSVREAEAAAGGKRLPAPKGGTRAPREQPPHLRALEERLADCLGTRVRIVEGKRKGKIVIEFYSNDDFERILEVVGAAA
jgi:ParB family chromosome partitioning protein